VFIHVVDNNETMHQSLLCWWIMHIIGKIQRGCCSYSNFNDI